MAEPGPGSESGEGPAFLDDESELARMSPEEQLFFCCSKGNTKLLEHVLHKAEESGLNLNATNAEGLSAMNIAVKHGFIIPVLTLLDHGADVTDTLLRAVDADFQEAVVLIVDHALKLPRTQRDAILKCKCVTTDIHPDVTPIIRAAQKNSFGLVKVLHEAGTRVEEFGEDDLETRASDSLQRSVGNLEIYRALASPSYVCFDPDPIGRAFHLSMLLRKLAVLEVEFKPTYLELANGMEQYAADLMSHVVTSEEAMAVLAYHGKGNSGKSAKEVKALGLLPTINRAIAHDQKKFVAQPTCQHALRIQFAQQLICLEDRPFILQMLVKLLIIMLFPVLCLTYKLGISSTCNQFVKIPLVKFFLQLASDLFLLGMIMYEIVLDTKFREMNHLTGWHYMIYVYALGMLWREILYMWKKRHQRNVVKIMNIVNMIIGLLLVGLVSNQITVNLVRQWNGSSSTVSPTTTEMMITTPLYVEETQWVINYTALDLNDTNAVKEFVHDLLNTLYTELEEAEQEIEAKFSEAVNNTLLELKTVVTEDPITSNGNDFGMPVLLSRSIMSLIVVISFSRIQPFIIAIDSVGPFSISFKSMFVTTSQFFSVVVAVLVGFATGLTFIYGDSYQNGASSGDLNAGSCSGGRGGSCSDTNYYESLVQSIATLYWSLFGLIPAESVRSNAIPKVLESMGELLYASFYVFSVLVLLNALIAVMSNVYNVVEANADTEWKFHRTYLWMSFLDESFTVPPPFNLVPQVNTTLKNLWQRIKRCCCYCKPQRKSNPTNGISALRDEISMDSMDGTEVSRLSTLDSSTRVDEGSYKRVMMTLVERYIAERTSQERKLEGDITVADMRNLKNDVVGLRYNLFKEVWCINEKLQIGNTESDHIDTEMTSVIDVFNALAKNKEDLENFERDVNRWLKNLVERLKNLPDIESLVIPSFATPHRSIRKSSNTVEEMVDYYESLKRRKTRRERKRQLMKELMK